MLYITTRNSRDTYTSHHALTKDRGKCGGLFLPFQTHIFSQEELEELLSKSFFQCTAHLLNLFFAARMDASDVEHCMGRDPLHLIPMSHKITIAEIWNNPEWSFSRFVRNFSERIGGHTDIDNPSSWIWVAVRVAVLFGVFGRLRSLGLITDQQKIDISVCSGDFSAPMAAWYARRMGLPIGTIVFSCNDNSAAWDLLHHGELHTSTSLITTSTPLCDMAIPDNLERLLSETLGENAVKTFLAKCESSGVYVLNEDQRRLLSEGFFGAVIGGNRTQSIIRNVYRTCAYLLSPYCALAYGGLQDYRAVNKESVPALIIAEEGPLASVDFVASALDITKEVLQKCVNSV